MGTYVGGQASGVAEAQADATSALATAAIADSKASAAQGDATTALGHATGDGSDHANVGLADTHRGLTSAHGASGDLVGETDGDARYPRRLPTSVRYRRVPSGDAAGALPAEADTDVGSGGSGYVAMVGNDWYDVADAGAADGGRCQIMYGDDQGGPGLSNRAGAWIRNKLPTLEAVVNLAEIGNNPNHYSIGLWHCDPQYELAFLDQHRGNYGDDKWRLKTYAAGVESIADTGVVGIADTDVYWRVRLLADRVEAWYSTDGESWTKVTESLTNIPTLGMCIFGAALNTDGAANSALRLGAIDAEQER